MEVDRRKRKYLVEKEPDTEGFETYKITGSNKSIYLRSNRPLLRAKGLKTKTPTWKVLSGMVAHSSGLEKLTAALMVVIDE